jgi:release factor glutamine methyltransferase
MTIHSALKQGFSILSHARVETPLLDSTVLLAQALHLTKERLYASLPDDINEGDFSVFKGFLEKRCKGIPVSYIRNLKEFYSLDFYVDERVLVPRPATEAVIETTCAILDKNPGIRQIHDLCTGSGCIAITLKHLNPGLTITASDISREAGEVFLMNSRQILGTELPFFCSDLLHAIEGPFDLIVSNPPYLTENEVHEMKANGWPEPASALSGGPAGTEVTQRVIEQASGKLQPRGFLVVESAPGLMSDLEKIMEMNGFMDIVIIRDSGKRERVITGRIP